MKKLIVSLSAVFTVMMVFAVVACEKAIIDTDETIPSDVRKMQFYYTGGSGAFNAATGLGSVASKQTVTGVTVNTDWAGETHLTF